MSQQSDTPVEAPSPTQELATASLRRRRRARSLAVALVLVAAAAAGGWYWWRYLAVPEPPRVDLSIVDPSIEQVLREARIEVCNKPRSSEAWGYFGMVLFVHEFSDEAVTCFIQAERLDPDESRWPYLHGLSLAMTQPEAAIGKYRRAAELPGDAQEMARLRLADLLWAQGHLEEAEERYLVLLAADPRHARAHLGLAQLAFDRKMLDECQRHLDECLYSQFTQKRAHELQAKVHYQRGDEDAAVREEAVLARAEKDTPWPDPPLELVDTYRKGAAGVNSLARRLDENHRPDEALQLLRKGTRDYPDKHFLWLLLGKVLLDKRDYREAEEALQKAVKLSPQTAVGWYGLGECRFAQGKYLAASEAFRKATDFKPDSELFHYWLGESLVHLDDRAGAKRAYRKALDSKPDYAWAHKALGRLLAWEGEKDKALEHLRQAVQFSRPTDAEAKQWLEQVEKTGSLPKPP